MVDVSQKNDTHRTAIATGRISMSAQALSAVCNATVTKGDVLAVARVAGIMAAKRTADLIPLCHPLPIASASIDFSPDNQGIGVTATVTTNGKTGVEMEALTAVSVALLTIYDMAKALDRGMVIGEVGLESKKGGKSGAWQR